MLLLNRELKCFGVSLTLNRNESRKYIVTGNILSLLVDWIRSESSLIFRAPIEAAPQLVCSQSHLYLNSHPNQSLQTIQSILFCFYCTIPSPPYQFCLSTTSCSRKGRLNIRAWCSFLLHPASTTQSFGKIENLGRRILR